mmetsp:Transcript_15753/g.43583  ORF Transcript_15753/g.43583 Transcript_15753/m.43583 type:complete len:228 (-) Transcript_15753:363-1046(-)
MFRSPAQQIGLCRKHKFGIIIIICRKTFYPRAFSTLFLFLFSHTAVMPIEYTTFSLCATRSCMFALFGWCQRMSAGGARQGIELHPMPMDNRQHQTQLVVDKDNNGDDDNDDDYLEATQRTRKVQQSLDPHRNVSSSSFLSCLSFPLILCIPCLGISGRVKVFVIKLHRQSSLHGTIRTNPFHASSAEMMLILILPVTCSPAIPVVSVRGHSGPALYNEYLVFLYPL